MKPATALTAADTTTASTGDATRTETHKLLYPPARTVEQVDDYFGTKVSDPYRWMEDVDSAELKTWIDAENELTQAYLAQVPVRETMQRRLMELINFERYTAPERRGTRYFYSHNSGLQNQNVLYWQEGLDGEPKVLLIRILFRRMERWRSVGSALRTMDRWRRTRLRMLAATG